KARLETELGGPMRWFSYPNGDAGSYDAYTRAALTEAGGGLALTFAGGFHRRGPVDPHAVPRIAARPRTRPDPLAATVTLPPLSCAPRPARRRLRPPTRSATCLSPRRRPSPPTPCISTPPRATRSRPVSPPARPPRSARSAAAAPSWRSPAASTPAWS